MPKPKRTPIPKLPCPSCGSRLVYNRRTERMGCVNAACRGRVVMEAVPKTKGAGLAPKTRTAKPTQGAAQAVSAIPAAPDGPKGQSELERRFAAAWAAGGNGMAPEREVECYPGRKWRADFCWPEYKVICEINGGTRMVGGGRHGGDEDKEKVNSLISIGFAVLQFSGDQIKKKPEQCVAHVLRTLINRGAPVKAEKEKL